MTWEEVDIGGEIIDPTPEGDLQLYTRIYYQSLLFNDLLNIAVGFQRFRDSREKETKEGN